MFRIRLLLSAIILLTFLASSVQATQKTGLQDVLQTIPPITTSSPNAVAGCTVLNISPGSVITGQRGFVQANCFSVAAVVFRQTTSQTPTFVQTGWIQISMMEAGITCSYDFVDHTGTGVSGITGQNLTSGQPVLFSNTPSTTGTLLYSGGGMGYNYCLFYSNPSPSGIGTFTISWA